MKATVGLLLLAVSLPGWWRESNSYRDAARGAAAFAKTQYEEAARNYEAALAAEPSARNAFNAGTASIAAGRRAEGAAQIEGAFRDPSMRADAYFNRGNSALEARAFDHAASDYIEALRANPRHAGAKRNLEIALQRKRQEEQEEKSQDGEKGGDEGEQQPQPAPTPDGQDAQKGELDLEALLRSAQQQEQEELRRLKGQPAEGKVGW